MKTVIVKSFILKFALAGLLTLWFCPAHAENDTPAAQEPEPHLVFKKTVVVKDYAEGKAHTEQHVIKKGEHLWKVLREQFRMSDTSINYFCKIAKAVNPEIEDLDVLEPSQNILLPFKFIPGDGSDNSTILIETQDYHHVVKPAEHLGQILRTRFNLPDDVIFNRITKSLIREANPDIDDLNYISPGQTITVPREVFAMQQFISHNVLPEERLQPSDPIQQALPEPEPELNIQLLPVPEPEPVIAVAPAREKTFTEEPLNDEELEIKQMLSRMTRQFAGTDNSTGREILNPDGSDNATLDYASFPAYNFPWGKKVVLDYGNRLPAETRTEIGRTWENAEVVSVEARDDMESIIGRVLDVCGFYKVEKDADYTVNRDAIQLSVTGNWIVFKDSSLRKVFVVNLAKDGKSSMSPSLRSYLSGIGLEVMDIGPEVETSEGDASARPAAAYSEISDAPAVLTDTILTMLNIDYETEYKTSIFQNMYSGFTLEVLADRMFILNGETRLIDFNSLPARITTIITQQGFNLLQITPGEESPETTAGRVLEFCGADFQTPPVTLTFNQDTKQNISLTMPGYVVQAPGGRILLTSSDVDGSISDFLREMDIAIVKY